MNIKNVMVPTDFSRPSRLALNYGVVLARALQARLTLVHVLETPSLLETSSEADIAKIEAENREEAVQLLGTLLAPEDEDDLNLRIVLKCGNARKEIAAAVQEQHADLVVLGTHGRRRLGRLILGSTTEALLRKLHVPVMTISHASSSHAPSPGVLKRILFATDLSQSSPVGFAFALDLARTLHAEILAVHALGGPNLVSGELGVEIPAEQLAIEEAHRRLETLVTQGRRHGIVVQTAVLDGAPAAQILNAAEEHAADLIVLSIETKGLIERALLGTTAEKVVREATVPVLSVPVEVEAQLEKVEQVR